MRAIKINPVNKTIEEVDVINPNKSLKHLYELIGCELVELVQLDHEIILICDEESRLKPIYGAFKFFCIDDLIICGIAIILGGNGDHFKTLHKNIYNFKMIVEWIAPADIPPSKQRVISFN